MKWLNLFSGGIATHAFFSTFFSKEYYRFLVNTSSYAIMFYSYAEICVKKIYMHPCLTKLKDFLDTMKNKNNIEIVKFNTVVRSTNKKEVTVNQMVLYDFIIYSDYLPATSKVNKVLYYDFIKFPINYSYSVCDFSFIAINVRINKNGKEETYRINLHDNKVNYYVVGNKINRLLICYLLKTQHNIICDELTDKYDLEIIDNNVVVKNFTEKDEIVFREKDYTTSPFVYCDTSNMSVAEIKEHFNYKDNVELSVNSEKKPSENKEDVDSIPE